MFTLESDEMTAFYQISSQSDNIGKNMTISTIMVDILQFFAISDNIRRYLTIFEKILSISNNIR